MYVITFNVETSFLLNFCYILEMSAFENYFTAVENGK